MEKYENIRAWKSEDACNLSSIMNNINIQNNLRDGLPFPYTEKDALDYINAMLCDDENSFFAFAITDNDNVVGSIGISRKENVHYRTAELGYCVAEEHWGCGLCTSAVKQACGYIFENTDIIRIFAEPFSYNKASCRVLEKAGFEYEGTLKSNAVKNGEVYDMKMYSKIKKLKI